MSTEANGAMYCVVYKLLEHEALPVSKRVPITSTNRVIWQEDDRGSYAHASGDHAHLLTCMQPSYPGS